MRMLAPSQLDSNIIQRMLPFEIRIMKRDNQSCSSYLVHNFTFRRAKYTLPSKTIHIELFNLTIYGSLQAIMWVGLCCSALPFIHLCFQSRVKEP